MSNGQLALSNETTNNERQSTMDYQLSTINTQTSHTESNLSVKSSGQDKKSTCQIMNKRITNNG